MTHESFRRPGSDRGAPTAGSLPGDVNKQEVVEVEHETAVSSRMVEASGGSRRGLSITAPVIVGAAALLAGLMAGVFLIDEPAPQPIAISPDSFPLKVLEKERDDIRLRENGTQRDVESLDAQFEDQLSGYRQAYGGEGATLTYKGFSLTILNGRLTTAVPLQPVPYSADPTWVLSLKTENTLCVSLDPPPVEAPDEPVSETKDVFYFLERGRFDATTDCVLFDEERNISLRLVGAGWRARTAQSAEALHAELVALHAKLTA